MTRQDVLDSLQNFSGNFPEAALKEVKANKADYIPELLESLDYVYKNAKRLCEDRSDYFMHVYAMYLLAEFREKKAFPYLIALLQLPKEENDFLIGDSLTESYHHILFSTFDAQKIQMLQDIIENTQLNARARSAVVRAYGLLYKEGFITEDEIVTYIRSLIYEKLPQDDSCYVFTSLVGCIIDTKLYQMIPDARFLHENNRIDTMEHGDYDEFLDWIFSKPFSDKPSYIEDAISEMNWWHCFDHNREKNINRPKIELDELIAKIKNNAKEQNKTVVQKNTKTGRNEPCPCGSGKKYKKCCYDSDRNSTLENQLKDQLDSPDSKPKLSKDKYDLLKDYPEDSPEFDLMFEKEAVNIDKLVYMSLHHRAIPIFVRRDRDQERIGKVEFLKEALELFLDKCQQEQITTFADYDELYMVHYRSRKWVSELAGMIMEHDLYGFHDTAELAADTLQRFG